MPKIASQLIRNQSNIQKSIWSSKVLTLRLKSLEWKWGATFNALGKVHKCSPESGVVRKAKSIEKEQGKRWIIRPAFGWLLNLKL